MHPAYPIVFTTSINPELIFGAFLLITISIGFHIFYKSKSRDWVAVTFLTGASFLIALWAALQDNFFNVWDEQYHALVAKSMTQTPFFPRLLPYPVIDYDFKNWSTNYVWVHKQPLFLWLMALSIKIFGFSEFSVRLPSVVAHTLLTPLIFKTAHNHFNTNVSYLSALLFTVSYYSLELVSGRLYTDHNDMLFMFFVFASFWAFSEYIKNRKLKWLLLMSMFSGFAILVKWLVGFLVYLALFIYELPQIIPYWKNPIKLLPPLIALAITCLIFVPWQIYILMRFPIEAQHELKTAALHFWQVVEGHEGEWYFHFVKMKELFLPHHYYWVLWIALPLGFVWELVKNKNKSSRRFYISIFCSVLFVYAFFTLAKSKLPGFCFVITPLVFIMLSCFIDRLIQMSLPKKAWINNVLLSLCTVLLLLIFSNFSLFLRYHTDNGDARTARFKRRAEKRSAQLLAWELGEQKYAVFNFGFEHTSAANGMLYLNNPCFSFYPSQQQVQQVLSNNYKVVVLSDSLLPPYLLNDNRVQLLKKADFY